jgi:hypothetical protein
MAGGAFPTILGERKMRTDLEALCVETQLEELVNIATPSKRLFGESIVAQWAATLEGKGYSATEARIMIEALLQREIMRLKFLRNNPRPAGAGI